MPISGHEETGFKSFAEQFSGLVADVPIKKRRFPLIHPSSTLSEESSSLTEETELLRKEQSTSQGHTVLNSSIAGAPIKKRRFPFIQASSSHLKESCLLPEENNASRKELSSDSQGSTLSTSSSVLFDTNRNPAFEERKASSDVTDATLVQSNSNYLRPKLEVPELATRTSTLNFGSKERLITNESYEEKLGPQTVKENLELLLAAKESLALNIGADISKKNVGEKYEQESTAASESTTLSLGFKQHLFPAVASLDIDETFRKTEKEESVSLKLSLSKVKGSSKGFKGDTKTNRANWDLNTTMDAWEKSGNDATSGKTSNRGLKITGSVLNEKHSICSTGMRPIDSASQKQTLAESQNKAFIIPSKPYIQKYRSVDPRNQCRASCLQKYTGKPSRLPVKQNSDCAVPTVNSSNVVACAGDMNLTSVRRVKSEPLDENSKQDLKEAPCAMGSLDAFPVKHESVENSNDEFFKFSNGSNMKLFDPKVIRSEPARENNDERPKTTESKSDQMGEELPQRLDYSSAKEKPVILETIPISAETACPPVKAIRLAELSTSGSIVSHPENHASTEEACDDEKVSQRACSSDDQVPLETVAVAMPVNATESSGPDPKDSIRTREENTDDPERCRLKLMNEPQSDPRGSGEGSVNDDEKITLSADMLEEDSYGLDYESDGAYVDMDIEQYGEEDDDYEDGEVREPLGHSVLENSTCEVREVERIAFSNHDSNQIEKGVVSSDCPTSSNVEESDNRTVTHSEINCGKDGVDTELNEKSDKIVCTQESLEAENSIAVSQMKSLDLSERKNILKASETELLYDQGTNESHSVDVAQCVEVVKNLDMVREANLDLPKMEVFANSDDGTRDVSNGSNQGRIVNLSRAASSLSPTKSMPISGMGLSSQAGRDVLSDAFDHENLHEGRDEVYIDGPHKFSRDRHQDMSPRHTRLNFVRGRGRFNNRLDTHRGEWGPNREFSGEFYDRPSQFRAPRHKFASEVHNADLEYNVSPDSSYVGFSHVNRKPFNDEGPVDRHITRRQSPGERESMQMGHRIPRTMSPSRFVEGDGSEFVGMRHGDKFMRGFPEDLMFPHPQPFERRGGGRFTRGSRNFSFQRRGPPLIHSKSPIRSRSRTPPGSWSPLRRRSPRRSPDGFGGNPELAHRRSPSYRVDRMRSPVFPGERVVRRHVSPSYMPRPNEIRDIDSGRNHGHPRSVISNRNPSGRFVPRNRRFDVIDPQDRAADNDEYFDGPMNSGRLLELNSEGNDERRRFGERRGRGRPVHSFRHPYNGGRGGRGENFHLDEEDGPRHYRFCADDSDFHERGNMRERNFNRHIKSRPENVQTRRTRNIDEEANYRNDGQVWSDDGFDDDISRIRRKRF